MVKSAVIALLSAGPLFFIPGVAEASSCSGTVSLPATCTGTLDAESGTPGSVVVEQFTLSSASNVTIFTTSYGGGMNLDGTTTPAGGFQPNLTLFNSTGFAVATESGSTSPRANADPKTGLSLDGYISDSNVPAGTYYATLTDVNNMVSASFSGFNGAAQNTLYTFFSGPGGTSFTDVQGNARNGNWALNIEATPLSSGGGPSLAPEPASALLVVPVLGIGLLAMRRSRAAQACS